MLWTDASTLRLQIMVSAAILECWTYDIMRFYGNLSYTSAFDPLLSNFEKKIRLRSCRFQVNAPDRHQTHPLPFPAIAGALVSGFFIRRRLFCCTCGAHVYMINHQSSRDTSVRAGVLRQRPGRWRALQSDGAHMLRNFQSVFIRLTLYAGPSYKRRKTGNK